MTKTREEELRASDRREASERAAQIRETTPFYKTENRLDVPAGVMKDGYKFHWGRAHIRNFQDRRLEQLQADGHEYVSAAKAQHKMADPLSRNRHPGFIQNEDCMLMMIPEVIAKERTEWQNKKAQARLDALPGVQKVDPNTRIQNF